MFCAFKTWWRKIAVIVSIGVLLLAATVLVWNRPAGVRTASSSTIPAAAVASAKGRGDVHGQLVFVSDRDEQPAIYVMNADGTNQRRLTHNSVEDSWPQFSPDGRKIAYESKVDGRAQIMVMDADGQHQTQLTSGSTNEFPSWSPDGTRLAFSSDRDGHPNIYVMNADGSQVKQLTDHPSNSWFPVWSPDARTVAFVSDRDGTHGNIFLMDPTGANLRQLTTNPMFAAKPTWSPDSTRLAIFAEGAFFTLTADSRNVKPVTGEGEDPSWSPDGQWIAYASRQEEGRAQIYLIRPDGSERLRVTHSAGEDWAPAWSRE